MRRSVDLTRLLVPIAVALAASPVRAAPEGDATPPSEGASPTLDLEARLLLVHPKFRLRDGSPALRGTSLRSQEIGAPPLEVGGGAALTLTLFATERLRLAGWVLDLEGAARLDDEERYGGLVLPFGTRVESTVRLRHVDLVYAHRLDLTGWLSLDLGLGVEVTTFSSHLRPGGGMGLDGVSPVVHAALGLRPREWLLLAVHATGLEAPLRVGTVVVSDQLEFAAAVSVRLGRFTLGVDVWMHHLHLEERRGQPEQDTLHLRLRGGAFVVGVTF